jgi:hypothetical protein
LNKFLSTGLQTYICHPPDSVAQLVEQYTFNVWALGSSPSGITKLSDKSESFFYGQNFHQAFSKSHRKAAAQEQQACLIAPERRSYTSAARAFGKGLMKILPIKTLIACIGALR